MESEKNISISDELIARYLSGEADPEEIMVLQEWLAQPANRNHFEAIQSTWHAALPSKTPRRVNAAAAWSSISRKIGKAPAVRSLRPRIFYLRIAASVILLVAAGGLFYFIGGDEKLGEITVSTTDFSRHIDLSDHSAATLNRLSTFVYPATFDSQTREVHFLQGEAFFNVSADSEKPFIVHTPVAHIRVVGTAFNVVVEENRLEVSVDEGKVMVYTENDSVILEPGFTGEVTPGKKSIQVKDSVNANDWGYATNRFIFKDTPLREVISSIEKAYPYSVTPVNGNIDNCRLTATFEKVSVEKMLNLIAETLNLSVSRNGKVFILEGEGCP